MHTAPTVNSQAQMPAEPGSIEQRRELARRCSKEQRAFKISLVIYLGVNALLLVLWAALAVAGVHVTGQLWPYPVVMVLWGVYVAVQGYTAYRGEAYTEEQIQREMKHLP
jgi:fatty acid desaturase